MSDPQLHAAHSVQMSLAKTDLQSIPFASLAGVTSYRQLLAHPLVQRSLTEQGLCVVRGFGAAVHPRVSAVAAATGDGELLKFLDALDPAIARKRIFMNTFRYHRAGRADAKQCMVQDRGCASETQAQTLRSAYSRQIPSLNPMEQDWDWDDLVARVLPESTLSYGSDTPLSLLGYERRVGAARAAATPEGGASASASASGSASAGASAAAASAPDLAGLDMTLLTAADCLYRALLVGDGIESPGMSSCYTYWGRAYSVFAAHTEDHNLPSINQLVFGAPKVWYAVPGRHYDEAVDKMTNFAPRGELPRCAQALAHKLLLPSLGAVRAAGLPCVRAVQWPGDLIITAPGAVHWGMNCGCVCAQRPCLPAPRASPVFSR